jgi:hypothetical protein
MPITMSKQLTLSAAFSVFAMAAFALTQGSAATALADPMQTGATIEVAAPALPAVDLPSWPSFHS